MNPPEPTPQKSRRWRIHVLMLTVLLIGGIATYITGSIAETREKGYLLSLSKTAATAIDPSEVLLLTSGAGDITNPAYIHLKDLLTQQRATNSDVRFAYLMGMKGSNIFFFVDSEPTNSKDYSPPGDPYPDATAEERDAFVTQKSFVEGPVSDVWGEWISAMTPVVDPATHRVVALLGMDIDTSLLYERVRSAEALPAAITVLFLALLLAYYFRTNQIDTTEHNKTRFVTLAAQQLRTPLTTNRVYADMMLRGETGSLSDQQREFLTQIKKGNQLMVNLVTSLLHVTHADENLLSGTPEIVDAAEITDEVISEFAPLIETKGVELAKRYPAEKVELHIDPELLRIILQNLVSNAVKYTPRDGTITVSLSKDEGFAHFAVADTGPGIPKSRQSLIFTQGSSVLHKSDSDADGAGLGLSLVKSIVDANGGRVWFASTHDNGSTFYVDLPIVSTNP